MGFRVQIYWIFLINESQSTCFYSILGFDAIRVTNYQWLIINYKLLITNDQWPITLITNGRELILQLPASYLAYADFQFLLLTSYF